MRTGTYQSFAAGSSIKAVVIVSNLSQRRTWRASDDPQEIRMENEEAIGDNWILKALFESLVLHARSSSIANVGKSSESRVLFADPQNISVGCLAWKIYN